MLKINQNYLSLKESYLFSTIASKVAAFTEKNPAAPIIKMGIGDVTKPLCKPVIDSLHNAVDDMGSAGTFKGYGPEQGYGFLHSAIAGYYADRGVNIADSEIFISDGAKSDVSNILDIFSKDNTVLIPDPVYPVYVDTNIMDGRKIIYADANEQNGFLPMPDMAVQADLIYLCSPNNPTGAVYTKDQLKAWVDYANDKGAVILFDAAYEAFIVDQDLPRSIFEIEGARNCAIEFCSLSKTAGFTGTRCGYTIVPEELERDNKSIRQLWLRRQTTKFNGTSYIVQKGAAAVFAPAGMAQVREVIKYYQENARIMTETMDSLGIFYTGGKNSPYVWFKVPYGMNSWGFFDYLLENANIVGTPGEGFGKNGEGFFRLTAFGNRENTVESMERIKKLLV